MSHIHIIYTTMWSPMRQDGTRAPPRHAYAGAGGRTECASYARTRAYATGTPRATASAASCCDSSTQATVGIPHPSPRLPQQMAEVDADLDLVGRAAARRRLRIFSAALLHHPELEVVAQVREGHSGLLRRVVRAGAHI